MDLRHFRYFIAVAEELSFSRAARRLHVSQPPLTEAIQHLERELGTRLLDRNSRRVALTGTGNILLARARSILVQVERCAAELRLAEAGKKEVIRVGFSRVDATLPAVIKNFRRRFPHVHLELFSSVNHPHRDLLTDGAADLNIGKYFPPDVQLDSRLWVEGGLVAILPSSHPLAGLPRIGVRQLREEPLFLPGLEPSSALGREALQLCREQGRFEPKVLEHCEDLQILMALVASEAGIGIGHVFLQMSRFPGVAFVPFKEKTVAVKGGIVWRRDRETPALRALIEELESQVGKRLRQYVQGKAGKLAFQSRFLDPGKR